METLTRSDLTEGPDRHRHIGTGDLDCCRIDFRMQHICNELIGTISIISLYQRLIR